MHDPRTLLLRALLLDWLGQVLILALIIAMPAWTGVALGGDSLQGQGPWLVFVLLLYPLLGWLFVSYTVLRWRRLALPVLLQRLLITAVVTLVVVAIARWLINPSEAVWLVYRRVQLLWIGALTLWALAVRVGLRRGLLLPEAPRMLLLAQPQELDTVLGAWRRVPQRQRLRPVEAKTLAQQLDQTEEPILVALSQAVRQDPELRSLRASLEMRDPRQVRALSVLSLFEQQQERLPPVLMADTVLAYDDLPWAATFSVQAQLKRMADLLVAAVLLLLTAPFVLLAALLIWLEDRGPVVYAQQRSGWLGRPFTVYKLRTMTVQPANAPARWTQPGDQRITAVGGWLRRVRLDELPQLLNVLNGEMSLIGPRPERPELEEELEQRIPHYRKRHWMRPGLSGWAQVCAPYASSIEDSDLKLSYDLYYLRHFSTWLDLVILLRTVKTVLKAGGR
ncbi:sugar transferase [Synechococcus sp. CS-197]|uniref:sugar transferase n=1 Tax=Synechococcus sp. CS-197 TaxID=2847985 RepID=UPI0001525B9B|nr:sugar transferase [Synechococcus sp. CS-197]CAK22531.1 Possible bacterial sugar transferase [Synechococcus sp. WH 7803]